MVKGFFCAFLLLIIFLHPLLALDINFENSTFPFINKESSSNEIAEFYKELGNHFEITLYYYFTINDKKICKNVYSKLKKLSSMSNRDNKFFEKNYKYIKKSNLLYLNIFEKASANDFADISDLIYSKGNFKIGKNITHPNEVVDNKIFCRLLLGSKVIIKYKPASPDYLNILCEEYNKIDKEAYPLMEKYRIVYDNMLDLFFRFTRENAKVFNQITALEKMVINNKDYINFMINYISFQIEFTRLLNKFLKYESKLNSDVSITVRNNLIENGVAIPELRIIFEFDYDKG